MINRNKGTYFTIVVSGKAGASSRSAALYGQGALLDKKNTVALSIFFPGPGIQAAFGLCLLQSDDRGWDPTKTLTNCKYNSEGLY